MWVWALGCEDPLEEGMVTHSSILAWKIPWTEEPGGLQFIESQRVGQDWSDLACMQKVKNFYFVLGCSSLCNIVVLITIDVEHLFMGLLAICVSSLKKWNDFYFKSISCKDDDSYFKGVGLTTKLHLHIVSYKFPQTVSQTILISVPPQERILRPVKFGIYLYTIGDSQYTVNNLKINLRSSAVEKIINVS